MSRLLFDSFDSPATPTLAAVDKHASMMAALLPPGKVWRLVGSLLSLLFAGCADELGRLAGRVTDLINEADPSTAIELLPDYESELALAATGTTAEQQANVVARLIARQRYRPVDFQTALAPLLAQDPSDVDVLERTHAIADAMGNDREIFLFFIYRDPTLPGTYFLSSAQALVNAIKPSHTKGFVIESINFLCDDPFSQCDRDVLGA